MIKHQYRKQQKKKTKTKKAHTHTHTHTHTTESGGKKKVCSYVSECFSPLIRNVYYFQNMYAVMQIHYKIGFTHLEMSDSIKVKSVH